MTMTKNTLLVTFLLFALVLFYWLYRTNDFLKLTALTAAREIPTVQAQVLPPAKPSEPVTANPDLMVQRQNEIRNLQQQLVDQRNQLEAQRQEFNEMKRRKDQQERQAAIDYTSRIAADNSRIQNLTDSIEDQRLAENEVNQAAEARLREQDRAAQVARDQIEQNIHLVGQSIQQTQEQIAYWKTYQANLTEQQARLQGLQNQLNLQQQQLNDLQARKVALSATVLSQTQTIDNIAQQQQGQLVNNQDEIQTQISTLRDEIVRLQTNQARAQMALKDLNGQVQEAQDELDARAQAVQELEDSLQKKQQEIGQRR